MTEKELSSYQGKNLRIHCTNNYERGIIEITLPVIETIEIMR